MNQPTLWGEIGGKTGNDHPQTSYEAGRKVRAGTQKTPNTTAYCMHTGTA